MIEKEIIIKVKSVYIDSLKRFYHILKDFCKKNIDGFLINDIKTYCQ